MIGSRIIFNPITRASAIIKKGVINFDILNLYKTIKGDLKVPENFRVSAADDYRWPQEFIGFRLGKYANLIKAGARYGRYSEEDKERLQLLGFDMGLSMNQKNDQILLAFESYIKTYGHASIPKRSKIPSHDESWPAEVRGLNLGQILVNIRRGQLPQLMEPLFRMGVHIETTREPADFDRSFEALQVYKQLHQHVKVPVKYVVHRNDPAYPERLWGVKLGSFVYCIRTYG